jgi:hypothetical protein
MAARAIPTPLVEPSVRTWLEWTPEQVRAAELLADAGSLRLAADLCDALLADDRVQGVLNVRARGLVGLPLSFEPGVGRKKQAGVRYLEAEEDWNHAYPEPEIARLNAWGIMLGVAPGQNVWERRDNGRVVPVLDPWHPRGLRQDLATGAWTIRTADAGDVPLVPGDKRWVLYTPGGAKRPWSQGAWRAVARWGLLKQYAISDWAVHGERARGVLAASPPGPAPNGALPGTADERRLNRQDLAEDLRRLGRNGAIVLPPGFSLKNVQAEAKTYETYREQITVANIGIAVALAGQNLTSEIVGGSFAAAEVHKTIANVLLRADALALATCLHDQVLGWWALFNLGAASLAPWPVWDVTPPVDRAAMIASWQGAAAAAGQWEQLLGKGAVDLREIARRVGFPLLATPKDGAA